MKRKEEAEDDNVYLKNLRTIKNIRAIVKDQGELHFPQMCVIGDQSSGKSALLQQLTGMDILNTTARIFCSQTIIIPDFHGDINCFYFK